MSSVLYPSFSDIKIRIFGILYDLGLGFHGQAIGTFHWYQPGAADHRFYGFCSVLIIAAFAYSGSEVVGLTAAEQENVKRDMPRAIKKVFWRIGLVSFLNRTQEPITHTCP
jgi:amino acid transporter